jgi:secreted PhoX family phosphatase
MTQIDRRTFLRGAAATAGAAAALGGPFVGLVRLASANGSTSAFPGPKPSYRGLETNIPDDRDGKVRLWLPAGFRYRSFHDTEDLVLLDDGTTLPGRHDGMGAFDGPGGNSILIRNHEVNGPGSVFGPSGDHTYDSAARGGTTTIEVTRFGEVVNAYTSLNGTQMNCAGGPMPWGAWVTCEETVNGPDVGPDFTSVSNVPLTQPHGFIYEVPVDGPSSGVPIRKAGRFAHEAVSFDPEEGILYLTEDNFGFPSGFYRYLPPANPVTSGHLEDGGSLQMLAVKDMPNADLASSQPAGARYDVEWVDIEDPDPEFPYTPGETAPTANDTAIAYVGNQGRALGAARFSRLEGSAYDRGVVYFAATQGGGPAEASDGPISNGYGNGRGQVWAYHTQTQQLELIFEAPLPEPGQEPPALDLPDNVTTSPRGTLILCEDSSGDNFLRGLSPEGQIWDIALNRLTSKTGADRFGEEFAGSTFSADGRTLFVNIQASAGMSFAIWGPWARIGV